jgi:HAD superfamily, subfamily IIIB (Acid phosphatase)
MIPAVRGGIGSLVRAALLFALGALTTCAIALAATLGDDDIRTTAVSEGTPISGIHPTGEGLPLVGAGGTVGAGDYGPALRNYHDSGAYADDLQAVDQKAEAVLGSRLAARDRNPHCTKPAPAKHGKCPPLAMVLDIDETSLSNYANLAQTNFTNAVGQLAIGVVTASDPPIQPTLDLYNFAKSHGVAVFFITGRPATIPLVRTQTEANLHSAGYQDWDGLILNPTPGGSAIPYKSGERAKIEQQGYDIAVNVGDQESDLRGGHADQAFKLPNPFYFIG